MRMPLLLDASPKLNKRGPEVLLGKGTWKIESNTNLFVVRTRSFSFYSSSEEFDGPFGVDLLELTETTIAQIELTGSDVPKASIFAVKTSNGINPSTT